MGARAPAGASLVTVERLHIMNRRKDTLLIISNHHTVLGETKLPSHFLYCKLSLKSYLSCAEVMTLMLK
jgi:hypothetical protein